MHRSLRGKPYHSVTLVAGSPALLPRPTYSLVIPVYNEEAVLPLLLDRLDGVLATLDGPAEVIFVDDGSRDLSALALSQKAQADPRFRLVSLSRNFGHQIAVTAGLDASSGAAVIVMDADLQDPPELILAMVDKWRQGFDVVSAQRVSRSGENPFKRATAHLFYRLISRIAAIDIPQNVGDFRLVDRKVVDAFCALRERERFVRGLFAWVGFKQAVVQFERPGRAAGATKYTLRKMLSLAANGIVSFSEAPLRLALWCGFAVSSLAFAYGLYAVALWISGAPVVPGWSSTIVVTAFLCGANMCMTGIMGLYVGRIHSEVKARPLYVVDRTVGLDDAAREAAPLASELRDARAQLATLEARLRERSAA